MRKTVRFIESISEGSGKVFAWFGLALVLLLCFEVFMRYVLDNPTSFTYEVATMLGVTIGMGGLAYTHLHHGHVRVDVFWRLLSPRGKAIADVIGSMLFFFPLLILLAYISAAWVVHSYTMHEISTETYMYPIVWPVRTVMFLGFFLIISQGVAKLIRDLYLLKRNELL